MADVGTIGGPAQKRRGPLAREPRGARLIRDSDGVEVTPGSVIHFGYGIPGRGVWAPVILRNGRLIAMTTGHDPAEAPVSYIARHFDFWVVQQDAHVNAWRNAQFAERAATAKARAEG